MQPPILAEARKGKSFGAIRNFAATFNWLVAFCRNLSGGLGVTVDRTDSDHPIIRVDGLKAPPLAPFAVRWSEVDSSLVVYLPFNACNLLNVPVLLTPATDADWYIINGGSTGTSTDGNTISIRAHIKGRVKATSNGTIQPAIFVEAHVTTTAHNENWNAGDLWCDEIALCTITATTQGGTTAYQRAVGQTYQGAVTHLAPVVAGDLELYWYTDTAIATNGFVPYVDASLGAAPWCRQSLAADVALSAAASLYVWYVVDCSGNTPTPSIVCATTSADPVPSTEMYYKAHVQVYSLVYGVLSRDLRSRLAEEVYYP